MTKLTTAALAAALIGGVSLTSGASLAATPSPTNAISSSVVGPTWVKMMSKKKMMMMKKRKMMHKKMMMKKKGMM